MVARERNAYHVGVAVYAAPVVAQDEENAKYAMGLAQTHRRPEQTVPVVHAKAVVRCPVTPAREPLFAAPATAEAAPGKRSIPKPFKFA